MPRAEILHGLCIHDVQRLFFVAEETKNRDAMRYAIAMNNPKAFLEMIEPKKKKQASFDEGIQAMGLLAGTERDRVKFAMRRKAMEYERQIRKN